MPDAINTPPDELRRRLRALGAPANAVEQRLMQEALNALWAADRSREDLREFYAKNPGAPGTYFLESIAKNRGIAEGIITALEVGRGGK